MSKLKMIADKCKQHRREVVNISLKEMGMETNTYFKTLSAFENGRSTNINHFIKYVEISDISQRKKLIFEISEILLGV
jgi:hypothetical protein